VEETRQKASFAGFLAKRHDAEIFILILYTSKSKALRDKVDVYTSQVVGYFNEEQIKHHVHHADCDNIALETIEYARKVDANLIAIMTQQEISTANIFLGSYAHQMVNNSPFPVLSVHPMSTASSGSSF
jgi:nucleotide-binding universal stress UspA family protein